MRNRTMLFLCATALLIHGCLNIDTPDHIDISADGNSVGDAPPDDLAVEEDRSAPRPVDDGDRRAVEEERARRRQEVRDEGHAAEKERHSAERVTEVEKRNRKLEDKIDKLEKELKELKREARSLKEDRDRYRDRYERERARREGD